MATLFRDFFFSLLPSYFKDNDNYKDLNNEGLLERYLRIYGMEIDENIYPFITNFLDIIYLGAGNTLSKPPVILSESGDGLLESGDILVYSFPKTITDDKFLQYLAYNLGSPVDVNGMAETYRKIVNYAVAIYKVKGTKKSYELLFNLLGLKVVIREDPVNSSKRYDDGLEYDTEGLQYDLGCDTCSDYLIIYYDKEVGDCSHDQFTVLDPGLVENIKNIVAFLEPINANLKDIVRGGYNFCELYPLAIEDEVTMQVIEPPVVCGKPFNLSLEPYLG